MRSFATLTRYYFRFDTLKVPLHSMIYVFSCCRSPSSACWRRSRQLAARTWWRRGCSRARREKGPRGWVHLGSICNIEKQCSFVYQELDVRRCWSKMRGKSNVTWHVYENRCTSTECWIMRLLIPILGKMKDSKKGDRNPPPPSFIGFSCLSISYWRERQRERRRRPYFPSFEFEAEKERKGTFFYFL